MKEVFLPIVVGVNATVELAETTPHVAGFLAKTDGTVTITDRSGATIVDEVPVVAGTYTKMPFTLRNNDAANLVAPTVTTADGASGTLAAT